MRRVTEIPDPLPGAAGVTPAPNWIEHPEPAGVSWTMRKLSLAERSASSPQPRLPWNPAIRDSYGTGAV